MHPLLCLSDGNTFHTSASRFLPSYWTRAPPSTNGWSRISHFCALTSWPKQGSSSAGPPFPLYQPLLSIDHPLYFAAIFKDKRTKHHPRCSHFSILMGPAPSNHYCLWGILMCTEVVSQHGLLKSLYSFLRDMVRSHLNTTPKLSNKIVGPIYTRPTFQKLWYLQHSNVCMSIQLVNTRNLSGDYTLNA